MEQKLQDLTEGILRYSAVFSGNESARLRWLGPDNAPNGVLEEDLNVLLADFAVDAYLAEFGNCFVDADRKALTRFASALNDFSEHLPGRIHALDFLDSHAWTALVASVPPARAALARLLASPSATLTDSEPVKR